MNQVIGDVLPIAFGIAVSPIPISAVVLLMLGERPVGNGLMFLLGWFVGVGLPASLMAVALTQVVELTPQPAHPIVLGMLLGLLALICWFLAWRIFRRRPRAGQVAPEPGWMRTLTGASPVRALALGLGLSLLNPEDLMLALSGGAVIGAAHLASGQLAAVLLVFTAIGSLTVLGPPLIYAMGRQRTARVLNEAKVWLIQHNSVLMAVLLAVIGVAVFGHAIALL